jgi:hypothetical protein
MLVIKTNLLTLGLVIASLAHADCYSIKDSDNNNICLAKTKNQSGYCYSVRDGDIKNNCLAEVKQKRSYCYNIRSNELKNECLALAENNNH